MEIIQFLKYDLESSFDKLLIFKNKPITFCFDFEDSIQDILSPENTTTLKERYRELCNQIIYNNSKFVSDIAIGFRINPNNTNDQINDIICIKNISEQVNIKSILLPKAETLEDLENLKKILDDQQISYYEIIPIIETVIGFNNLYDIGSKSIPKVFKIAFGHCDYNLSLRKFPFAHQDSKEYWNWIHQISLLISGNNLLFLNSAYQKLDDDTGFNSMLYNLSKIFKTNFGQFTLTLKQTRLCLDNKNKDYNKSLKEDIKTEHDLEKLANNIIYEFEKNNSHKGFSIEKGERVLISPHEYISAKYFLNKK